MHIRRPNSLFLSGIFRRLTLPAGHEDTVARHMKNTISIPAAALVPWSFDHSVFLESIFRGIMKRYMFHKSIGIRDCLLVYITC